MNAARRLALSAALAAPAFLLAACGDDGTGPGPALPGPPLAVTVRVSNPNFAPAIEADAEGLPLITCPVELEATARGQGTAVWGTATFRWYFGTDRRAPVDSQVVSALEIQSSWGEPGISAREPQQSEWTFSANFPFAVTISYVYQPEGVGESRRAEVTFECGPAVPADAPPPTVTALTLGDAQLEAGDTLLVSYTTASGSGLWATVVELEAPCEAVSVFVERMAPSVSRTVPVVIPGGCPPGEALHVTVYALDAGGREGTRTALSKPLVDLTAPQLHLIGPPWDSGGEPAPESSVFFVGDSVALTASAFDAGGLRAIVWELLPSGVRDSQVVAGAFSSDPLIVRFPAAATGPAQIRVYARDAAGLTSEPVTSPLGAITVLPTVERPTRSATVSGEIRDFVIDERRGLLYLMQSNERRIAVLSLATMQVLSTLPTSAVPLDMELTLGGDSLLVTPHTPRALGIVDLRQSTLALTALPLTGLDTLPELGPVRVRVASTGKAFVAVAPSIFGETRLLEVDLRTGAQRFRTDAGISGATGAGLLGRSLDHSVLLVVGPPGCLQRYDAGTDRFGPCRDVRPYDVIPAVDGRGQRFALGSYVYDAALLPLLPALAPPNGTSVSALSADGEHLFEVNFLKGITRRRVDDGVLLDRTLNPRISPSLMRVSADGTWLVTAEGAGQQTGRVSVIDLR